MAFCYVEISTRGIGVFVLLLHIQILAAKRSWLFVERDYIAFLESGGFCTEGQIHRYRLHIRPLKAYHPGPLLIIEDPTAYGLGNSHLSLSSQGGDRGGDLTIYTDRIVGVKMSLRCWNCGGMICIL